MKPKNEEMMTFKLVYTKILDAMIKQGISFVIMLGLVVFFYNEHVRFQEKIDSCNATIIQMYADNQARLIEALNNNTKALEQREK